MKNKRHISVECTPSLPLVNTVIINFGRNQDRIFFEK